MKIKRKFGRIIILALFATIFFRPEAFAQLQDDEARRMETQGKAALERWDYAEAGRLIQKLFERGRGAESSLEAEIAGHRLSADTCFYKGDYACAVKSSEMLAEITGSHDDDHDRYTYLADLWKDAAEVRSEHFIFRYVDKKDAVLAEPALETMESAYKALTQDFDTEPGDPVLVEVYPSFEGFQAATNLSAEALENSGTIAVCKYRRLMINSPRILVRGYSYRDTLSHEYVHFLVYQKYGSGIPIWLHEGLAKYEEERWRREGGSPLTPGMQSVLASALRQDELISFQRMHPSFAYLETPRQGMLAFAEVTSVIDYLLKRGGWKTIFKLCEELRNNRDYKGALRKVTGMSFDFFWSDWKKYAKQQGYKEIPGMEITAYEIRKGEEGFEQEDQEITETDMNQGEEYKYARLGDLLRNREHYQAAQVEYQKAREIAPYSLKVMNKQGLCYCFSQDYEKAVDPLARAVEIYPEHSTSRVNLGRALVALKRYDEATKAF